MKPTFAELISILQEQKKIYGELLELSRQKQENLIKGDIAALEAITGQEEGMVFQVGKLEEKRENCFNSLVEQYGLEKELTLQELLPQVPEQYRSALGKIHEDFAALLTALKKFNQENTNLIEQSLRFVNFSVDVISQQSKPLYNADQEVKVERLTNLVDKKI